MSIPSSGSSTLRSASITSSCVGTGTSLAEPYVLAPLAREEVDAVDEAHPVAAGAHHERVRARRVGEVAHAAQQLAARDAGGGNDHLLRREVVDGEDALDVLDAVGAGRLDLRPPRRPELRLELAAEAAEGGRGEHRLPGAADPDREVVVRAADRDGHRREDVAVLDQLDARPDATDLLDQVVVARAVEHDRGDVRRRPAVGVGDRADGVRDRGGQRDGAAGAWPDGQLAHVHVRQQRHRPPRPGRDHRDRVAPAAGHDRAALERVDREVDLLPAGADRRARRERLRARRPADHDLTADRERLKRLTRRRERGRLGRVAATEPARGGERGPLGDPRVALAGAGHETGASRSAEARTSSSSSAVARSTSELSITGTPCTCARSRRYSWIRRMSPMRSRYRSIARTPPVSASRTWKRVRCTSSLATWRTAWTTSAPSIAFGTSPGTRWTPSSTIDHPSASARSIAASTPTSTFRVWSTKPGSAGSPSKLEECTEGIEA